MNATYLVIAEVKRNGFIFKTFLHYDEAERYSEELLSLPNPNNMYDSDYLIKKLQEIAIATYNILGTELYLNKCKTSISNGEYTISIIEIDPNMFSMNQFMKERTNCSIVFPDLTEEDLVNITGSIIAN